MENFDAEGYYKWIALQTVANDYFKTQQQGIIDRAYDMHVTALKAAGLSRGKIRYESQKLKTAMERDYRLYAHKTTKIVKEFDDHQYIQEIVDHLHASLEELKIEIVEK